MAGRLRVRLALVLAVAATQLVGGVYPTGPRQTSCLNNAVYDYNARRNVTFNGRNMPLTLTSFSWASGKIWAMMFKVVAEEMLGVHTVMGSNFGSSVHGYRAMACLDPTTQRLPNSNFDFGCCEDVGGRHGHIVIETWAGALPTAIQYLDSNCPDKKPINKGNLGLNGMEPIFVMDHSLDPAASQYHLPLQYYMTYSTPGISMQEFFDDPWNIPLSDLKPCNASRLGIDFLLAQQYRTVWGAKDPNGTVSSVNSQGQVTYSMDCSGAGNGYWWLSPKCRENTSRCLPYFTGGNGWLVNEIVHKATAYDMPVAVSVLASWGTYTVLPKQKRGIFYWWWPDALFTAQRPKRVVFPTTNLVERSNNNYRTAESDVALEKWATWTVENRSNVGFQQPLGMLENMALTPQWMDDILAAYIRMGGSEDIIEPLVCQWLNNNTDKWLQGSNNWLPDATTCQEGQGLVRNSTDWMSSKRENRNGTIVDAEGCNWCPPGRMSVRIAAESTFKCVECPTGAFQGSKGETECIACAKGTVAPQAGTATCANCPKGRYADRTGQVTCQQCQMGINGLPDFQTRVEGATSEDACICPRGYYRDVASRGSCLACLTGMTCEEGSDALGYQANYSGRYPIVPKLLKGYWSSAEDPLSVFRCDGDKRCPGGRRPGSACLIGLKEVQGCAHCEEGTIWNGESCTACGGKGLALFVFPILPFLVCPVIIIVLYKIFGDTYARWGTWQNGCAASVFILLNHYQIVNLIKACNLAWDHTVIKTMDVFAVTSDVATIFRPDCSGLGNFKTMLIMRALIPIFLAIMYVLVWATSYVVSKKWPRLYMEPNRTLNGFFSLIFTFFAGIAEAAFTVFKCVPNPNGTSSLKSDRSVTCNESDWNDMVIIGIVAVAVTVCGFGGLFIRSIIVAPHNFHNKEMQMRWKFLFIRYRADVHWWAVVFVFKGIYLNLGSVIITMGAGQLIFIMGGLLLYGGLLAAYRPWRHMPNNGMDFWAHLSLLMAAGTAMWYAVGSVIERGPADDMMSICLTVFIFTTWLPCPAILPYFIVRETSGRFMDTKDRKVELIIDAFDVVMVADKEERELFLQNLNEWDFWFLMKSKDIIQTHIAKRRCRSGYSIHALDEVSVETRLSGRRSVTSISSFGPGKKAVKALTHVRF